MRERSVPNDADPEELKWYYSRRGEAERLSRGLGLLERARTEELLERYLPPPPAVVLDVGGGPGVYACWLARKGYTVHLTDVVSLHLAQAREASRRQPDSPIAGFAVGDARNLERRDASAGAVLLLGPLYHLTQRDDRVTALREARRVLQPGGVLLAAVISRFASTLDGLVRGLLDDPVFMRIVRRDLSEGQHRNPERHPGYFTTAYLHHPDELRAEIAQAGLQHEATLALEGPGWLVPDLEQRWQDPLRREILLRALRWLEREPSLQGVSAHLVGVARKEG